MTAPILADRVMKARRQSACPICRGPVGIGQQIARLGPGSWVHAGCLISLSRHQEDDLPTVAEHLSPAALAALARRQAPAATSASQCAVARLGDRVVIVRADGGGLLADLTRMRRASSAARCSTRAGRKGASDGQEVPAQAWAREDGQADGPRR